MIAGRLEALVSRLKLLSGVSDAGFASLGTFLAGVIAVRELPATALALYVVLSSAAIFTMPLPRQLVYFPAQIGSNTQQTLVAPVIRRSVRTALGPSLVAAVVVVASGAPLVGAVTPGVFVSLTVTAVVFGWISPLQDHIRGSLHVVERHARAATCSVVLAVVIAVVVGASLVLPLPPEVVALLPFGSLVLGNLASSTAGVLLLRGAARHDTYGLAALSVRGRYLFIELVVQGSWFACNYIVLGLLGAAALARLEAARITASPVLILATGVSTFMLAALLRQISARDADRARSRSLLIRALAIVLIGSGVYASVVVLLLPVISTALNRPIDGLLAVARIGSYALEGSSNLVTAVLLAIGASRTGLVASAVAGAVGLLGTALAAPLLGPVGLPLAQGAGMLTRLTISLRASRDRFRP